MYKVMYLTYLRYNRKKTRKKRIVGEGGAYLKVGKRNEFYRVYTKSQVNNIGRPNNTLQKKRKKIKTKYDI